MERPVRLAPFRRRGNAAQAVIVARGRMLRARSRTTGEVPRATFTMGSQGRWVSVSARLVAWLGCTPAECLGRGWQRFVDEGDRLKWHEVANDLQAGRLNYRGYLMRLVNTRGDHLLSRIRFFVISTTAAPTIIGHVEVEEWARADMRAS